MINKALFTSNRDDWATPNDIFQRLNKEFDFNLDPCASHENHKCNIYYTVDDDGLSKPWGGYRVFCNPPYSEIDKWVEKAWRESRQDNTLICLLIPARVDTRYFHNFIYQRAEIRFVKGRLKFGQSKDNAPFPSMVVIFRGAYV